MNRKTGEIVVPTEPVSRATKITGFTFKSYDKSAGVLQFQIKNQDGSPTDLIDATVRLFMYIYQGEEKKEFPIFDNQIITESYMQGIVKYPIPDMLLSYEGKVDANVYIDLPDGSHTDNLAFTFNIEKSIIDGDVQLNGEYYFKDFQQLLDGVKQEATDSVNAALTNVDSTIEKANQQINEFVEGATQAIDQTIDEVTEQLQDTQTKVEAVSKNVSSAQNDLTILEDRIDQTNQQIGDLGKLKRMYSNSIDFGGKGSSLSDFLDAPYYLSKVPLQENIANTAVQFPISSSKYTLYSAKMQEPFVVGNTYTITLEGTKPSTQVFSVYGQAVEDYNYGSMEPVRGLVNTWSLTFTPSKVSQDYPTLLQIIQQPGATVGACTINWLKIEKGETRTPNISEYKYFGEGLKDSNNPNDYSWDVTPEYTEKGLNDSVSLTEPETILGLKNFAEGLQSSGVNVAVEYAKAIDTDKYTKHGAIYLGGCAWLTWETLTFQKTEGYAKGSYIRLGADGNASFTYSDVPNIFGGYLWLGGVCQPDYTDGGFSSYHITIENNFDDARKPIVRFIDSPTTPVKKLAVRGFALVFAPAPTENSQVKE